LGEKEIANELERWQEWNSEQEEACMLGYQQGYSDGYSEGHEDGYNEGFEFGLEKGRSKDENRIGFMKITCVCGYVIPYPVTEKGTSFSVRFPDEKDRRCPNCRLYIPGKKIIKAYSEFRYQYKSYSSS